MEIVATSGMTEHGDFPYQNYSGVDDTEIASDSSFQRLTRELALWSSNVRAATQRGNMFDRMAYSPPNNVFDEIRTARIALEQDDVVSGVADITEAFAFQGMKWEAGDDDEADVFNQWAARVNLDGFLRRMWREEYAASQCVVAMIWDYQDFTVRTRKTKKKSDATNSRKRRKQFRLWAPTDLRILDSTKIVPVGFSPVGDEKLAWCATEAEVKRYTDVESGNVTDAGMLLFFSGKYTPSRAEEEELVRLGVDAKNLLLLNPEMVWRHTVTKPDYQRFADVRIKSLFGLLDMKRQLMNADRAHLVGAANYILLIRKGTDERPAVPEEIEHLKENYKFIAKLPAIIADHRLQIDIIAPKIDLTLQNDKYDLIDTRILMRLLGTLSLGARGQRNETSVTLSHAVARMMENRRHMIRRGIEKEVSRAIVEHPRNRKYTADVVGSIAASQPVIEDEPSLVFLPRNVSLGFDAALMQALLALRTQREISRETILENFGLDQLAEAMRMEFEDEHYDDIFKTAIPFNGQQPTGNTGDSQTNGAQGGRPQGGGSPSQDATKQNRPTGDTGNTKRGND